MLLFFMEKVTEYLSQMTTDMFPLS